MNKWSDITPPKPVLKKEEKVEIDWLQEVETVKKECLAKTKTNRAIYPPLIICTKLKNYTEAN